MIGRAAARLKRVPRVGAGGRGADVTVQEGPRSSLVRPTVLSPFSGGPIFAFFAGMMVLQLLFVWLLMPETKGKTLEELESELGLATDELKAVLESGSTPAARE